MWHEQVDAVPGAHAPTAVRAGVPGAVPSAAVPHVPLAVAVAAVSVAGRRGGPSRG